MDPTEELCPACRTVRRRTVQHNAEPAEDSDDGDPAQPMVPSQEQADDVHFLASDAAELQQTVVNVAAVGREKAGFKFQMSKTKQMVCRKTIRVGAPQLVDALQLPHKQQCKLCGLPLGQISMRQHMKFCKLIIRVSLQQW